MCTKSKIVNISIFLFLFGIYLNCRLSKEISIEFFSHLIELIPSKTVACFEFKLVYLVYFVGVEFLNLI